MNFMNALKKEQNKMKTLTENGAIAYASSGKEILDFNFSVSAFRNMQVGEIMKAFVPVWYENPELAVKYLFYLGDVRGGIGERKAFRACLLWLAKNHPEICKAVLDLVPEYNRWDSLLCLLDTPLRKNVSGRMKDQLVADIINAEEGRAISLLAKWMPSENASSKVTKRYAKMLIEDFGWTPTRYRKNLSRLRRYLDVVEVKMSGKRWGEIEYESVPSKANLIYKEAFLRNDNERRLEYLASLKRGDVKINAGVLQPHEIVNKYMRNGWWGKFDYDETLEQLWANLPCETLSNTLVVRDGSGSMCTMVSGGTRCLDVATALTIYMADHNSGDWRGKFVTFSHNPKVIDLTNCENLRDKLEVTYAEDDCSNTDIYSTMMLILDTAVSNKMSQDDMPEMVVICSDMGFDASRFNLNKSLFEEIIDEYEIAGYKMPKLCFWNINGLVKNGVPLQQNDMGLILCSGFSTQIMKMFLSAKLDPYEILLDTLNNGRYAAVERAVAGLL